MTNWVGTGLSIQKDPFQAAKEATIAARLKIPEKKTINLAFVFSSVELASPYLIQGLRQIVDLKGIIGCSGAAIILDSEIKTRAVAVMLISTSSFDFSLGVAENISKKNMRLAGEELASSLLYNAKGLSNPRLAICLPDGLIENGTQFLQGIQDRLGKTFPLVGGFSSDNLALNKTHQYYMHNVLKDSAVGILLGGKRFKFGLGLSHGLKPIGKPHVITQAKDNWVKYIENKPAYKIYEDYLGKTLEELKKELLRISILYPLGIYIPEKEEYILRNVLLIEEEGILCSGDISEGAQVRLMIGTKESALRATEEAIRQAKASIEEKVDLAIIFDSIFRLKLLGRAAEKEIEIIQNSLGKGVPLIGFYSYAEQAPLKAIDYRDRSYLHSQAISILTIGS